MVSKEELGKLALYCSQHPDNGQAIERLFRETKPIAYSLMKWQCKYIPYYDKEDYLQETYITLYRVLMRISVCPEIKDHFFSYYWASVRNTYAQLFRNYVLHHLVEISSYESREGGYNYSQMVYFQKYVDDYYAKKREYGKKYYNAHRDKVLEHRRQWRMINKEKVKEDDRRYYWNHREEINEKRRMKTAEKRAARMQNLRSSAPSGDMVISVPFD